MKKEEKRVEKKEKRRRWTMFSFGEKGVKRRRQRNMQSKMTEKEKVKKEGK